jgi:Permuted papain-like amidase enzyme, YaeF/YiiX, C92 family
MREAIRVHPGETGPVRKLGALLGVLFVALLIPWGPESRPPPPELGRSPFAWNRDTEWTALEAKFVALRAGGCTEATDRLATEQPAAEAALTELETEWLAPDAPQLDTTEHALLEVATTLAACPADSEPALKWLARFRDAVKRQSTKWDLTADAPRARVYRLLYASRAALEEALLQQTSRDVDPVARGRAVPSAGPSLTIKGVEVHSGDLLVSLIARGSDFPGNFSHVALLHIDEGGTASIIEAEIELGVRVTPLEQYLQERKLRVMVLRLRDDLPELIKDPLAPARAADAALARARAEHIAYDLSMDAREHTKLFCSELAFATYEGQGLTLWPGNSHISSPGTRAWLWSVGVRNFATLEPSDLEYDPKLAIVAEWFNPEALTKDHRDNAVTDVLLEEAEAGKALEFDWWRLPLVRLAKGYSLAKVASGKVGPVPEGMTPEAALRSLAYTARHAEVRARLDERADAFKREHGYAAPYWQLVKLAREAR